MALETYLQVLSCTVSDVKVIEKKRHVLANFSKVWY